MNWNLVVVQSKTLNPFSVLIYLLFVLDFELISVLLADRKFNWKRLFVVDNKFGNEILVLEM